MTLSQESMPDSASRMHHLLRQVAEEGVEVRISGGCMRPFLWDGDRVRVVRTRLWWPGDVLIFRDHKGCMLAHRLLGFYQRNGHWKLLTQADSARRPDCSVFPEQVLGKAVDVPVTVSRRIRALGRYLHFAFITRHRTGLSS